jgi:hypothetical protein
MKQSQLRYEQNLHEPRLSYTVLIEHHIDHLLREHEHRSSGPISPQLWFLTATFVDVESKRKDHLSIPPQRCFILFEQFYVRLLPKLMSNFARKRPLQPLTYAYIDYPFTKLEKPYACLSNIERFYSNRARRRLEHPEITPHIHAVMLVAPALVDRFNVVVPQLESLFRKMNPANRTLHAVQVQTSHELRDVMFYSSKLLKQPEMLCTPTSAAFRHESARCSSPKRTSCDIDLYTVLPKAESEPIYVKADWERELEAALKEKK